jgi:hypothetical protein
VARDTRHQFQFAQQIEIGGANRDRTDDLKLAKLALSQLSYGPVAVEFVDWMVGLGRLELPTSRLSSARSNQLSYKPDEAYIRTQANRYSPRDRRKKEGKRRRRQGANCLNVEVWEILVRGPETIDP